MSWHPRRVNRREPGGSQKLPTLFFLMDFSHNSLLRQRLGNFFLFHLPWIQLWKLASFHELQTCRHSLVEPLGANSKATCEKSLEELHEDCSSSKQQMAQRVASSCRCTLIMQSNVNAIDKTKLKTGRTRQPASAMAVVSQP